MIHGFQNHLIQQINLLQMIDQVLVNWLLDLGIVELLPKMQSMDYYHLEVLKVHVSTISIPFSWHLCLDFFQTGLTPGKDYQFSLSSPFSPNSNNDWITFSPAISKFDCDSPFGPLSSTHTPHRESNTEGIAQLLVTMSSQKPKQKRRLDNHSIFDDNGSTTKYPPPPSSVNRSLDQSYEDNDDNPDTNYFHRNKYRRGSRNGHDDQFDRLVADNTNGDLNIDSISGFESLPFPSPKKKRNAKSLSSPVSMIMTRQRSKSRNQPTSPVPSLEDNCSPVDHTSAPSPGYMSPSPEKSSRKKRLPSHPGSCSPYRTRSQSQYPEILQPIFFDQRKDTR